MRKFCQRLIHPSPLAHSPHIRTPRCGTTTRTSCSCATMWTPSSGRSGGAALRPTSRASGRRPGRTSSCAWSCPTERTDPGACCFSPLARACLCAFAFAFSPQALRKPPNFVNSLCIYFLHFPSPSSPRSPSLSLPLLPSPSLSLLPPSSQQIPPGAHRRGRAHRVARRLAWVPGGGRGALASHCTRTWGGEGRGGVRVGRLVESV